MFIVFVRSNRRTVSRKPEESLGVQKYRQFLATLALATTIWKTIRPFSP